MLKWILYRALLIVPTLLLVLGLSFVLSKSVYSDPIEAALVLKGVALDTPHGQKEYKDLYHKMKLDQPLFYFAILPHYYPQSIHAFYKTYDRSIVKNLLSEKVHIKWILNYLILRNDILENKESRDVFDKNIIERLNYAHNLVEIRKLKSSIEASNINQNEYEKMLSILSQLDASIQKIYYPIFIWHGHENQFHMWVSSFLSGNWGVSYKDGISVRNKIGKALKWTLVLTSISLVFTTFISYFVGLLTAFYTNTWMDRFLRYFWLMLYTMPVFWLASLLITFMTTDRYGSFFNIFPLPGRWYIPEEEPFWTTLAKYAHQMILPIICLVANDISPISQLIRRSILNQKLKPFVLLSQAKGLTPFQSFKNHLLPHSYTTLVTVIGGKIPALLSGSLIVEVIFNIPGIGRLIYDSVLSADWSVVFGVLTMISFVVTITMLISDIMYRWIDPRTIKSMS